MLTSQLICEHSHTYHTGFLGVGTQSGRHSVPRHTPRCHPDTHLHSDTLPTAGYWGLSKDRTTV